MAVKAMQEKGYKIEAKQLPETNLVIQAMTANQVQFGAEGLPTGATAIKEGAPIKRGQVIGFVGTTGNAPRDTPHLHFAIFKLSDEKKWWQGTPIDPYSVLR